MSDSGAESEVEYTGLLKQALEVQLSSDFDPNSTPRDGYEYIQHVIYERKRCEECTVAKDLDQSKFKGRQTKFLEMEEPVKATSHTPSPEWQTDKLESFHAFRKFIDSKEKPQTVAFFHAERFVDQISNELPVYSCFSKYTNETKIRMLELITEMLQEKSVIEENIGIWVFAILSTLELPLCPSHYFGLREFAKKCLDMRAKLPEGADVEGLKSLNFFICVISKYFTQLDLADEL